MEQLCSLRFLENKKKLPEKVDSATEEEWNEA